MKKYFHLNIKQMHLKLDNFVFKMIKRDMEENTMLAPTCF